MRFVLLPPIDRIRAVGLSCRERPPCRTPVSAGLAGCANDDGIFVLVVPLTYGAKSLSGDSACRRFVRFPFGAGAGACGLLCSGRAHCPVGVNHVDLFPRQVAHGATRFSARPLSVDFVSPDRISISAEGAKGRVCTQCSHRTVVRLCSRDWPGVQPPAFGTDDV